MPMIILVSPTAVVLLRSGKAGFCIRPPAPSARQQGLPTLSTTVTLLQLQLVRCNRMAVHTRLKGVTEKIPLWR